MNRTESSLGRKEVSPRLTALVIFLAIVACGAVAWYFLYLPGDEPGPAPAPRSIQSATLDVGDTPDAVELRYIELPWGPVTFGHMENGTDETMSKRTWPFAHLTLKVNAHYEGKDLAPGDYIFVFTPKGMEPEMALSLVSFKPDKPGGTFLVPANVRTETPKDVVVIHKKPIKFATGAPVAPALHFDLEKVEGGAEIRLHYGDRTLTERLAIP